MSLGAMRMHIEEINAPVFELDDMHPAKRFLEAFLDCLDDCVGRQHGLKGTPIDHEWRSATDGRLWTFSGFAYTFLSYDIELDGFLTNAPALTESETDAIGKIPKLREYMRECAEACRRDGNKEILALTDQVNQLLDLWEEYIRFRQRTIQRAHDQTQR
jgi:hypothetical protein